MSLAKTSKAITRKRFELKLKSVLQPICMWIIPLWTVFVIPSGKDMLLLSPLNLSILFLCAIDLMLYFKSKLMYFVASINSVHIE